MWEPGLTAELSYLVCDADSTDELTRHRNDVWRYVKTLY